MANPGETDNLFLVVVLECCEKTAGRAMAALLAEHVTALKLPHISHLRMASERMRPRVFVVDAGTPGRDALEAIRLMRSSDPTNSLIVILLGDVNDKALSAEMRKMLNAYLRKPLDWKKLARTAVQLANNRKPPTTGVILLRQS